MHGACMMHAWCMHDACMHGNQFVRAGWLHSPKWCSMLMIHVDGSCKALYACLIGCLSMYCLGQVGQCACINRAYDHCTFGVVLVVGDCVPIVSPWWLLWVVVHHGVPVWTCTCAHLCWTSMVPGCLHCLICCSRYLCVKTLHNASYIV
jgi:hypothetical protein